MHGYENITKLTQKKIDGMLALLLLLSLHCTSKLAAAATDQCDIHQFSHPFHLGESCKEIYGWNPQTHNRSGYYWHINPPRHAYFDMEQQ